MVTHETSSPLLGATYRMQNAMELRQFDVGCRPRRLPRRPWALVSQTHQSSAWSAHSLLLVQRFHIVSQGLFQCSPHPLWLGKSASAPLGYSTGSYSTVSYSTGSHLATLLSATLLLATPLSATLTLSHFTVVWVSKSMYIRSFRTKLPETNIIAFCLWKIDRSHQVEPPV